MTLAAYLDVHGITVPDFAKRIGSSETAVTKWKRCERFPSDSWMRVIAKVTSGAVMPNDFAFDPNRIARAA